MYVHTTDGRVVFINIFINYYYYCSLLTTPEYIITTTQAKRTQQQLLHGDHAEPRGGREPGAHVRDDIILLLLYYSRQGLGAASYLA